MGWNICAYSPGTLHDTVLLFWTYHAHACVHIIIYCTAEVLETFVHEEAVSTFRLESLRQSSHTKSIVARGARRSILCAFCAVSIHTGIDARYHCSLHLLLCGFKSM